MCMPTSRCYLKLAQNDAGRDEGKGPKGGRRGERTIKFLKARLLALPMEKLRLPEK